MNRIRTVSELDLHCKPYLKLFAGGRKARQEDAWRSLKGLYLP